MLRLLCFCLFLSIANDAFAQKRWGPNGCDNPPAVAGSSKLAQGWYQEKDGWKAYYDKGQLVCKVHTANRIYKNANGENEEYPWCDCCKNCECTKCECGLNGKKQCSEGCKCCLDATTTNDSGQSKQSNFGLDIDGLNSAGSPSYKGDDAAVLPKYHTKGDRKSTRLNSSHVSESRMPSSA